MKRKYAAVILAAGVTASVCSTGLTASANSASPYWEGADGVGVYLADASCPLQVKSENLTFNVTSFPNDGSDYSSSVTADYNFYNPESYDITARMWFPFGREPEYYSDLENESEMDGIYGVTVDGESVEAEIRYSYYYNYYDFDFEEDSAYLRDEKVTVNHLGKDTAVTKVTVGETDSEYAVINYTLTRNKTTILTHHENYGYSDTSDEAISAYIVLDLAEYDYFYIVGDMPTSFEVNEGEYISGSSHGYATMTLVTGENLAYDTESAGTLDEFLQGYNILGDGKYSEVDWFNFCVYSLNYYLSSYWQGYSTLLDNLEIYFPKYGISDYAMRWYDYTITVKAGGYARNTVTAPTYPTIYMSTTPNQYIYSYLLSPASTWASFENLTITINAPYYLLDSSVDFTMTGSVEDGTSVYTATLASLPDEELSFTLCADANPSKEVTAYTVIGIILVVIVGLFLILGFGAIPVILVILSIFL